MFTDSIATDPTLLGVAAVLFFVFWKLLGSRLDSRIFLALNFSFISLWVALGDNLQMLRLATAAYMILFVVAYRSVRPRTLSARLDKLLDVDLSFLLIGLSVVTVVMNLQAGFDSLDAKALLLEQQVDSAATRYVNYLLMTSGWIAIHVICHAAAQPKWSRIQVWAVVAAILSFATGLSKASFLPILLTLLFVYSKRLGFFKLAVIGLLGLAVTIVLISRLFQDLPLDLVTAIFFQRIVKNVDVIDFISGLGGDVPYTYPHSSVFYLFWPFFQFTQSDFMVPGVWLYGQTLNDWRGFGPNPTFIVDQLLAAKYIGLIVAPLLGLFLRASDRSSYRIFLTMFCYSLMQDWYFTCVNALVFFTLLFASKLLTRRGKRTRRIRRHSNDTSNPHPVVPAARQTFAPD